jgi:adenine-specific DNA-methyltransferase
LVSALTQACMTRVSNSLELLLNGLVYELFLPEDLHAQDLHLFDAAREAGLMKLDGLTGEPLSRAAADFARTHLTPGANLFSKLLDLQTLDAVRIIEGKT